METSECKYIYYVELETNYNWHFDLALVRVRPANEHGLLYLSLASHLIYIRKICCNSTGHIQVDTFLTKSFFFLVLSIPKAVSYRIAKQLTFFTTLQGPQTVVLVEFQEGNGHNVDVHPVTHTHTSDQGDIIGMLWGFLPSWSLTVRPWKYAKSQSRKGNFVFQASFFMGELLVLGRVPWVLYGRDPSFLQVVSFFVSSVPSSQRWKTTLKDHMRRLETFKVGQNLIISILFTKNGSNSS